jgi:outer membrane protein OmpA-like peptidoglycan-associated protein
MIRALMICLLLACLQGTYAQNLIANADFEDRNTCDEYHVHCAAEAWFRIPLAPVSPVNGTAGFLSNNHYENILVENNSKRGIFRSFIYTKLLCRLEKGRTYVFSAYFKSENGAFDFVNIQLLDFEPYRYQTKILKPPTPPLTITEQNLASVRRKDWREYAISFVATGEEEYLLIGNLIKDDPKAKKKRGLVIYNIDNVSLRPAGKQEKACPEKNNNQVKLYQTNYRHTPNIYLDEEEFTAKKKVVTDTVTKKGPATVTVTAPPAPENPPVIAVAVPPVNDTLVIPDVLFKFDKSELNPVFSVRLDTLVDKIRNRSFQRIEILGHTDSLGTNVYNQKLSQSRSETVKNYLVQKLNYPEEKIVTKAFAATLPVSTNRTSAGRQKNRRVEIVLVR